MQFDKCKSTDNVTKFPVLKKLSFEMDKLTEAHGMNTFTLLFSRYVAGLKTFLSTPAGLQLKVKGKAGENELICG